VRRMSDTEEVALDPQCGNGTVPKPSSRATIANAGYFFFCSSVIIIFVCVGLWVKFKNRFERTRFRSTTLIVVLCLGMLDDVVFFHLAPIIGTWLPCWLMTLLIAIITPLVFGPIITRLLVLLLLTRFSEEAAGTATAAKATGGFAISDIDSISNLEGVKVSFRTLGPALKVAFGALKSGSYASTREEQLIRLAAFRYWKSALGIMTIVTFLLLPYILLAIGVIIGERNYLMCYRCDHIIYIMAYCLLAFGVLLLGFGTYVYCLVRPIYDVWGLKRESQLSLIAAFCSLIFIVLGTFSRSAIARFEETNFRFAYLITVSLWAALLINTVLQLLLARQAQNLVIPHRTVSMATTDLNAILADKELCDAFEQHLVQEFGIESLLFVKDVALWKSTFYDIAANARRSRAQKIFATYIAADGMFSVNIPGGVATDLKRTLNSPEELKVELFDEADDEIRFLLTIGAMSRFMAARPSTLSAVGSLPHTPNIVGSFRV
jgi:hypothetical protein